MTQTKLLLKYLVTAGSIFSLHTVHADTIKTINGATLVGLIKTTTKDTVTMQTDYAGTITIPSEQIADINKDEAISRPGSAAVAVAVDTQAKGAQAQSAQDRADVNLKKHPWNYSIAANLNGSEGNVDAMGTSFQAEALRISRDSKIKLYTSLDQAEVNGDSTANQKIAGASYVNYIYNSWGWFMSTEMEQDPFEYIDLRASISSGVSYRIFNKDNHSLEIRTGLGYRHEAFLDDTTYNTPTLDFGLNHEWTFKPFPKINPWLEMSNILSFTPSIRDFDDYMMMQDSGINMPIGNSNMRIRMGVKNDYNNQPVDGVEQLDTTYYSRLMLDFN